MIITVDVTAEDIAKGAACDGGGCPVALALARLLGGPVRVSFDGVRFPGTDVVICLPADALEFIARFDDELPVEPFSFGLDIPDDLIPAGATP